MGGHQSSQQANQAYGGQGKYHHHEQMFRRRFWISLLLSFPVLLFSTTIQDWLGFSLLDFPGQSFIVPGLSIIIFIYGGLPFLRMAIGELRDRQPGMMTLISLAISVAFIYSLPTLFVDLGSSFFWELVTLIDVMLLGHWIEMRSVRQASNSLDELATFLSSIMRLVQEAQASKSQTQVLADKAAGWLFYAPLVSRK